MSRHDRPPSVVAYSEPCPGTLARIHATRASAAEITSGWSTRVRNTDHDRPPSDVTWTLAGEPVSIHHVLGDTTAIGMLTGYGGYRRSDKPPADTCAAT